MSQSKINKNLSILKNKDLLLGLIVFSPLSSFITIDILHLPFSLPELLFIPFFNHFKKNWWPHNFKYRIFVILFLFWLSIFACALIIAEYNLKEILGCGRTYLYIFFFITLFYSDKKIEYRKIFILSIGALIGWSIDALYNFTHLVVGEATVSYGPMIALPIMIGYPILHKNNKFGTIIFIISTSIGIFGLLRRVILISFINYILCLFWNFFHISKKKLHIVSTFAIISLGCISLYPFVSEFIKDYNYDMYVRLILKSESMFNGETNEGDEDRVKIRNAYFSSIDNYIIPRGFVSKAFTNGGDGSFNDFPIKEISHTFGILFTIIFLLFFFFKSINIINLLNRHKIANENLILDCGYITILILLILEGSFITFPYQSIYTGFFLGALAKSNISKNLI